MIDAVAVVKETHLSRRPARGSLWVALVGVCALLVISAVYWFNLLGLASYLPAVPERVFRHGEYWRLATSIGAHADFRHFLSNGIVFGVLSFLLYGYFGTIVYPVLTLGLGCLVTAVSLSTYAPGTQLLGASGVVYWMAGFWLTSYLFIERRLSMGKRLLRASGFALIILAPTVWDPSVSYRTHAIGFVAGILSAAVYCLKKKNELRKAERVEWD